MDITHRHNLNLSCTHTHTHKKTGSEKNMQWIISVSRDLYMKINNVIHLSLLFSSSSSTYLPTYLFIYNLNRDSEWKLLNVIYDLNTKKFGHYLVCLFCLCSQCEFFYLLYPFKRIVIQKDRFKKYGGKSRIFLKKKETLCMWVCVCV